MTTKNTKRKPNRKEQQKPGDWVYRLQKKHNWNKRRDSQ